MTKDELLSRVKTALALLPDGHTMQVGDLSLCCSDNAHFTVKGWTIHNLENVTQQTSLTELEEIKSLFAKMVIASNDLADFIKDKQIEYYLGYDDGKGSIGICKEVNEQIKWETVLQ
ncbi:MAG: hypothetical protein ABUL44_03035 [Flavobacterium sp.]